MIRHIAKAMLIATLWLALGSHAQTATPKQVKKTKQRLRADPRVQRHLMPYPKEARYKSIAHPFENPSSLGDKGQSDEPIRYDRQINLRVDALRPSIERSFEANHLRENATPPDNHLAISNAGYILSVDNGTIDVYTESGRALSRHVLWEIFFSRYLEEGEFVPYEFFDPKCIYDKANDRFIMVVLNKDKNFTKSKMFLCFSASSDPSGEWNVYEYAASEYYEDPYAWFDYPNIAVNAGEVFVSVNVFDSFGHKDNLIVQADKQSGYEGSVEYQDYQGIKDPMGRLLDAPMPLSDAMQSASYDRTCYFVSNLPQGGNQLYWFSIDRDFNADASKLSTVKSVTTQAYSTIPYANQPGEDIEDRINVGSCRLRGGYHQNGKLHLVYMSNKDNYGQIVYSRISTLSHTEQRTSYGLGNPYNYCYPSIAHHGNTDAEENAMIAFLKVGPLTYPSVGVVNHTAQQGWSQETIVKEGEGLVAIKFYEGSTADYERWGDYTCIQRKYNTQTMPKCWLVGSYGLHKDYLNYFDVNGGYNAWIGEVGQSVVTHIQDPEGQALQVYPNPALQGQDLHLSLPTLPQDQYTLIVCNALGQELERRQVQGPTYIWSTLGMEKGVYLLHILNGIHAYATHKILVH